MDDKLIANIAQDLGIISRALSYLCLNSPSMSGASIGRQAKLLQTFGFDYKEIAELLDSKPKTISVRLAQEKKKRGKKLETNPGSVKG